MTAMYHELLLGKLRKERIDDSRRRKQQEKSAATVVVIAVIIVGDVAKVAIA